MVLLPKTQEQPGGSRHCAARFDGSSAVVNGRRQIGRGRQRRVARGRAASRDRWHRRSAPPARTRRLGLRNLGHALRGRHPLCEFLRQIALVAQAEGGRVAPAAAANRADDLEMLGASILEQRSLARCLDEGAHFRQCHRALMDVDLAEADQMLDKSPQTEFFEIDVRHSLMQVILAWARRSAPL